MTKFQATVEVIIPNGRFQMSKLTGILSGPVEYDVAQAECEAAASGIRTGDSGFQFYDAEDTLTVLPHSLCREVLFQFKIQPV